MADFVFLFTIAINDLHTCIKSSNFAADLVKLLKKYENSFCSEQLFLSGQRP